MAVKSTAAAVAQPAPAWENPLIPSKRLRQLYAAMVELRLLEEHLARIQRRKSSLRFHTGEEACMVSTVLSLRDGDLTSECSSGSAIAFLRGKKLPELVDRDSLPNRSDIRELPPVEEPTTRLNLAIGAALALASRSAGAVTVAYVHAGEMKSQQWKPLLKLASSHAAPILFVVLPHPGTRAKPGKLSLISTTFGVPGIPVDAADPIALYRVVQESLLRIRAGGGPVLMECIPFQIPGEAAGQTDPIERMQQLLVPRGVATEAWFDTISDRFTSRLRSVGE